MYSPNVLAVQRPAIDGASWSDQTRSAKMYCARQWDPEKFAKAASLLESNGLLLTQMIPASELGPKRALIYSPFTPRVANFLKVFDSGVVLKHSIEEIEQRRKSDPSNPDIETIGKVRAALNVDAPWTVSSSLPQEYQVSANPEIKLVTTVGLTMNLWQLWSYSQADVFSGAEQKTIIANITGQRDYENTNIYADHILVALRLNLTWARELRSRLEASSSDSPDPGEVLGGANFKLRNDYRLRIPVACWYTWKGHRIEGTGVQPDVSLENSPESLAAGIDAQLEKAKEVVQNL